MAVVIEVFSAPDCGKCGQAVAELETIIAEFPDGAIAWREVNILEELDYAVSLGVLATPAIAIDGELRFTGLPASKVLRQCLRDALAGGKGGDGE